MDSAAVLTPDAVEFLTRLQRRFGPRREELLAARAGRGRERLRDGELPDFLPGDAGRSARATGGSRPCRPSSRTAASRSPGPVDRKMVINALNSGAKMFMADFEDSNSPTWANCIEGQVNLTDALERTITLDTGEKQLRAERRDRDAARPPARLAPRRAALRGRRRADLGEPLRLRPLLLPQPRAAAAASSTCRSSRATSRRGSGTTSSSGRRTSSACRTGRSRRPS